MYGCPGCGAELKYDIKTGKLRCLRCGNKYDVQAIKKPPAQVAFTKTVLQINE